MIVLKYYFEVRLLDYFHVMSLLLLYNTKVTLQNIFSQI